MQQFEQLGVFYLGKQYDLARGAALDELVLYDSKDLTTHAVCVGMTGSGKTGLCLALLEEAAIDGIPAICIDPKGDLGNLLLTFPNQQPEDFKPWLEAAEAQRKGISLDELAAKTANTWREGLAAWGQDGERVRRFRESVDTCIYTPGSSAGMSLTVLRSFDAPGPAVLADSEALAERVKAAVSGLLALLGVAADPLQSREHILLANILDRAWQAGKNLQLADLIREIQQPSFDKLGFVDLESFYPAKERFELAMRLNNLLASPGFQSWLEGEPLDIQRLLYTPAGKPRLSIISIAHLSDNERMFFVTILLNEMIAWMRAQTGTSSLRALLYMDEVFGYFPPTANPPSKTPMLLLLKQARAFGLGVVLATQNPVDLDYKGLSNCGTWLLGRLQTERDKARVLDGLEGAAATTGTGFDRAAMEQKLAALGNRVFLMNNVHEVGPIVFQTRWALSYLRGPLARDQIASLMAGRKQAMVDAAAGTSASAKPQSSNTVAAKSIASSTGDRPMLPPGIAEYFLPSTSLDESRAVHYRPALVGRGKVHFVSAAKKVDEWREVTLLAELDGEPADGLWQRAAAPDAELDLQPQPAAAANFAELPGSLARPKTYSTLATQLKDHLYRGEKLTLWTSKEQGLTSQPGESEGDFRVRVRQVGAEGRDDELEKLRAKYAAKVKALEERRRKAEQKVEKEQSEAKGAWLQSAISLGTTVLGAMLGRKRLSTTTLTRAGSSMRSASRAAQQQSQIGHAQESAAALQKELDALNTECETQTAALQQQLAADKLPLEELPIQPRKSDIAVEQVALVWIPTTEK